MPASIDVIFTPNLLPISPPAGKTVVVADILRATTTITFAIANGALGITPVLTPDDAFEFAANRPNTIICGERRGKKVNGFHLGNSPCEYTKTAVSGKQVVLTTTNGTRTLWACRSAKQVLVGCFLNLHAIINSLMQVEGEVVIVCAGREGSYCMEDTAFAGACVASLSTEHLTDAADAAKILYRAHRHNLHGMLKDCYHGRNLAEIGLADDLEFCSQLNLVDVVPIQVDGQIVPSHF